ncbi:MAG: hypothetical protein AB1714_28040 [Acidobacteriota bacterium]
MLLLIAIGLLAILTQVVLMRELSAAFYGIELIYLLALGAWLLWNAGGALVSRRTRAPSLRKIGGLLVLLAITIPLDVAFIRAARHLFGGVAGAYLPFPSQIIAMCLAMLPVSLLLGLLFQWAAKLQTARGRTLAVAYAVESAGGVLGGLLSTMFLLWGVQNFLIGMLCATLSLCYGASYLAGGNATRQWFAATAAGLLTLPLLWRVSDLDRAMTRWNHPDLLDSRDSPYGRITVDSTFGQMTVFDNDALSFESEGTDAEVFAHLVALQHPDPKRILTLGGGVEGVVHELLKHRPERIDYVELNAVTIDLVLPNLPETLRKSVVAPCVRTILGDPRTFLRDSESYDVIVSAMAQPTSGQANRFYTVEFFRQAAARLRPVGVLGLRLRSAENFWTPQLARQQASIVRAIRAAFADVVVLPGTSNVVVASQTKLPRDPRVLADRLSARGIMARLISPAYVGYLYQNDRFMEIARVVDAQTVPANTDSRPICYQYTLMIWLSKFFPRLSRVDLFEIVDRDRWALRLRWLLPCALALVFLLSRLRPAIRRALLVAAAGFAGMVLESVLLLHYQLKSGVVYQNIGVLLMSFMAGLALGALLMDRLARRGRRQIRRSHGLVLVLASVATASAVWWGVGRGVGGGLAGTVAVLMVTGLLVAAVFGYASLYQVEDQTGSVSPLYAADLIGGALGSAVGSLMLIPLLGLPLTAACMAVLSALAMLSL